MVLIIKITLMSKSIEHKKLAEIVVNKLRDENYSFYLKSKESANKMTVEEYDNLTKNPNYDPELQKIDDERFYFFNSLDEEQKSVLDRLILSILDATAFNFLREIEENLYTNESITLKAKGADITEINKEFLSGTLFGEYFMWIEEHSKYGKYQH